MALVGLVAQEQVLVRSEVGPVAVLPSLSSQGAGGLSMFGSF
jgi:hypothetical protein